MVTIEELYDIFQRFPVVSTDSRTLPPDCIFFALKGENFDGNTFAEKALSQGAAYAVIDNPAYQSDPKRYLLVPDVLKALQGLARRHRRQFDIPLIAIGGSNGKTTTKELVAAVLAKRYPCHATKGNLNNHIGVPLTLLAMPAETEVAVIEMGANHPGDMAELCALAEPTHGLLTNIGKEHLEGFGSLEGVKKAEGELYDYLRRNKGWIFVNASEKYLKTMTRSCTRKLTYAASETLTPQDEIIDVQLHAEYPAVAAAFLDDAGQVISVQSQLLGRHNFHNIMTAIALGIYFKVPGDKIKAAIEGYHPTNNRSQLIQKGNTTILLDAYNANPSSMTVALDTLAAMPAGRKVAVLGDMLELGADSLAEHRAILRYAAGKGLDALVLVGPEFGRTNWSRFKALHFNDTANACAWFAAQNLDDALVLIKGSRSMRLEQLVAERP